MAKLNVDGSRVIKKNICMAVTPFLLVITLLVGSCRDTRSQYPVFDPEYAAEVFCDCMKREWGKRSHGENWDFCYYETRMHSHYFDLHRDSTMEGGSTRILGDETPGYYFSRWLKLTKECRNNVSPSKYDSITLPTLKVPSF